MGMEEESSYIKKREGRRRDDKVRDLVCKYEKS